MARQYFSVADIIRELPYKLQIRFNSFEGFVSGIVAEEEHRQRQRLRFSRQNFQVIQLCAFIYTIDEFFRAGTRAARDASTLFEEFGYGGFQVGSTYFDKDNENTRRGENLANQLRADLQGTEIGQRIGAARSLNDLVATLARDLAPPEETEQP